MKHLHRLLLFALIAHCHFLLAQTQPTQKPTLNSYYRQHIETLPHDWRIVPILRTMPDSPNEYYWHDETIIAYALMPEYEALNAWYNHLEPRLYPSGEFFDASGIIWEEIQKQQKSKHRPQKQSGNCPITTEWVNIGPFINQTADPNNTTNAATSQQHNSRIPGIGRVNIIRKHPTINNRLYLGASNGGLWRSDDAGQSWQALNDQIAVLGVADLAFDPENPDIMYLATGDKSRVGPEAIGTSTYSLGVLKSTDGGATWLPLAPQVNWSQLSDPVSQGAYLKINRLLITADGSLLIGTTDSPVTPLAKESGIWKWNNATATWDKKLTTLFPNEIEGAAPKVSNLTDMLRLPNGKIIAATQHGQFHTSADNGNTFSELLVEPAPASNNVSRVVLAAAPSNPNVFYALRVNTFGISERLLKFTAVGSSYQIKKVTIDIDDIMTFFTAGNQHLGITVSPTNENTLFIAGNKEIFKLNIVPIGANLSTTPTPTTQMLRAIVVVGSELQLNDANYVHPDVKEFTWADDNTLYVATDGGIARTSDGGNTWTNWYELTANLAISECYRIGETPGNMQSIFVGTHDNGAWRWVGNDNNPRWLNIREGDCGEVVPIDENQIYAFYFIDDKISRIHRPAVTSSSWQATTNNPSTEWGDYSNTKPNTGVKASLVRAGNTLYASNRNLHKGTINESNITWLNNPVHVNPVLSGGDVVSAVAVSPSNHDVLYAAYRRSGYTPPNSPKEPLIYQSQDAGSTWVAVYDNNTTGQLPQLHLNRLAVHPTNPQQVWAVFSGYTADQKVYVSDNGGVTWQNVTGGGLPNLPVNTIVTYLHNDLLHIAVGTDAGVYYSNATLLACTGGQQWQNIGQSTAGFPVVIVQELEIHGTGDDRVLRAATFGRGVWQTPLPTAAAGCICASCGQEGYPLQANFTIVPEDAANNAQFEPMTNWLQWLTTYTVVKLEDASIGVIQPTGYEWSIENDDPFNLNLNCQNDPLGSAPCALTYWAMPGAYNVSLTVTDVTGCSASHSKTVQVLPYQPDCTIAATPVVTAQHPLQTCNTAFSTCPTTNENGALYITPISTELASGAYSYTIHAQNNPNFFAGNSQLIQEESGQLALHCLPSDNYTISVTDLISGCTAQTAVSLNPAIYLPIVINTYTTVASNVSSCTGKIQINQIDNLPIDPNFYHFEWSDCATCNTSGRENLCSGIYTISVTDSRTGCMGQRTIYLPSSCATPTGGSIAGTVLGEVDVYPTVFSNTATVKFTLTEEAEVSIDVYNLYGIFVKKLLNNEVKSAGEYHLQDDVSAVTNGVYIYIVKACTEVKADIGIKH